jgi:hypothetical protein
MDLELQIAEHPVGDFYLISSVSTPRPVSG